MSAAEREVWRELVAASCATSPPPPRPRPSTVMPLGERIAELEETVAIMQTQMADLRESLDLLQRSFILHGVKPPESS